MKKLVKELKGIRKVMPKPTQVLKSKRKRKLEKLLREELNDSRNY